jgi:phosphoglycolate phosphatase-like HAD superfamily hydrolase
LAPAKELFMNTDQLIIFDIDGTLTNTNLADSVFFERAVLDSLPLLSFNNQWHTYSYSTDSGILTEIVRAELNRDPSQDEIEQVKEKFVFYLEEAFNANKMYCSPIEGAQSLFETLTQLGWNIGIATGGWEKSAGLKLKTAGIPYQHIPMAHSDDHMVREEIISIAIKRAQNYYKKSSYSKIIYVGDRSWDKNAANNLGIRFIGIGKELEKDVNKNFFHINNYTESRLFHYLESSMVELTS